MPRKTVKFSVDLPPNHYKALLAMGDGISHSEVVRQMVEICVPRAIADPLGIAKPDMSKYINLDRVGRFGRVTGARLLKEGKIKLAKTPTLKKILGE